MSLAARMATALKALHIPGEPIVFANVYDTATARLVGSLPSCKALATASYAIARAADVSDDDITLEQNLAATRQIAKVTRELNKPLTADIQSGYGDRLEEAIKLFIEAGVSGCNLEDFDAQAQKMYTLEEAASRIKRAIIAACQSGVSDFVVNARCDTLMHGGQVAEVIERGNAYLEAGATTVFVLGGRKRGVSRQEVGELIKTSDGRLSVMLKLSPGSLSVAELANMGVARISVGPQLQEAALNLYAREATEMLEAAQKVYVRTE